ncbi:MAG: alpha-galactosidase [Bacteroidaceae bacterium]|nr:alpha-galactosidase [Bacteroidaceae bacterium]
MRTQIFLLAAAATLTYSTIKADNYVLSSENTSLIVAASKGGGEATYRYFGAKLTDAEARTLDYARAALGRSAYPTFGLNSVGEKAFMAEMPDGSLSLDPVVQDVERSTDKNGQLLIITYKDRVYPFQLRQYFKLYNQSDVFSTWTEYQNLGKKDIKLLRYYSANVPLPRGNNYATHFHGNWGAESQMQEHYVTNGETVLSNKQQLRNAFEVNPSMMVSFDGEPQENAGRVFGANLMWSGNFKMILHASNNSLTLLAGINDDGATYVLQPQEIFTTPELAMAYSTEGKGGVSRAFHRWALRHALMHGDKLRDILLNSWEGVYMNVNQPVMDQMMADIASLGGELFVMDDGWFGDKYPRNNDHTSLGDWMVNPRKLPEGIEGLIASSKKHSVKFGIWIEPEMANTQSELYDNHPDWILSEKDRPLRQGRGGTQVVLDLTNPKVQDFVFGVTDQLLSKHPEIAYIKWDNNADIMNYHSPYLPSNRQQELNVRYHQGLRSVLQRLREKYPDIVIQVCASGGGRANYGLLPFFDEFWTSDDTDAIQRLFIQWGDSHFYPAKAQASHVSASPNHQTRREVPLKFRFDVAMTGRLGMELQPKNMTDAEREFASRAITAYKDIRPVVQEGDQYRLVSPYLHGPITSLMYASQDKRHVAFFAFRPNFVYADLLPSVQLAGVDEHLMYKVRDLTPQNAKQPCSFNGKTISGRVLKQVGLRLDQVLNRPLTSVALELVAE